MSGSEKQRGCLRKQNLSKPSTLADLRYVSVEYRHSNALWAPPQTYEIVSVTAVDGKSIDPGEYWFFAQENRLFPLEKDSVLTQGTHGEWERR
jgi:hypothetical protein